MVCSPEMKYQNDCCWITDINNPAPRVFHAGTRTGNRAPRLLPPILAQLCGVKTEPPVNTASGFLARPIGLEGRLP